MMDVINPWGALRRAKIVIIERTHLIDALYRELDEADARVANLKAIIAQGHFRNPKTGCIGPKGKVFK
jgi:hypothetical protein